jgi:hypothetical protein
VRALVLLWLIGACGAPRYQLAVTDTYEVGEDATVELRVREASKQKAVLLITRPDGSTLRRYAPLREEVSRIKFGAPLPEPGVEPTFTMPGHYTIELRLKDKVLASRDLEITLDRLDEVLPADEVAGYTPVVRYTRPKQSGTLRWKTFGAIYEHPSRKDAKIEVLVEAPEDRLATAWKPYEEDTTLGVIENNNVRLRERSDYATASWRASQHVITMRARSLAELERGLIGHFLARFPSKLLPQ